MYDFINTMSLLSTSFGSSMLSFINLCLIFGQVGAWLITMMESTQLSIMEEEVLLGELEVEEIEDYELIEEGICLEVEWETAGLWESEDLTLVHIGSEDLCRVISQEDHTYWCSWDLGLMGIEDVPEPMNYLRMAA